MFPLQVVCARVMKKAVAYLQPFMEEEGGDRFFRTGQNTNGHFVKGDVHDIGKNIRRSVALQQSRGD